MRADGEAPLSRWKQPGLGLLGFCAGLALMRLLAGADAAVPHATEEAQASAAARAKASDAASDKAQAKSRARPEKKAQSGRGAEKRLSFTPAQWTKVMRNPGHYQLSLLQCFPLLGADELPPGRSFDGRGFLSDPHPSFGPQAELFGWSQDLRLKVREQVLDYGREMAATEKKGARVEYPEPGLIRIDFSAVHAEREAVAAALRKKLDATVGRRDAERFLALASLEGVSAGVQDELTIRAYYLKSGAVQLIGVDGMGTTLSGEMAKVAFSDNFDFFNGRYDHRLLHLGQTIDWSRLNPDPESR